MTVALRSTAGVTNGTAGTSVVVSKPAGTVDGDALTAFISAVGNPTITAPAGWTLRDSATASTNVTISAYTKVASGEGASWTWTLSGAQRNWGEVTAWTGVDTSSPFYDSSNKTYTSAGTVFAGDAFGCATHYGGVGVNGTAAVRTAGGSATTWTQTEDGQLDTLTELADRSTNAGAGTDICGTVGYKVNTGTGENDFLQGEATASQSQTHAAIVQVALRPAFVSYTGAALISPVVRAAFGADPNGDPTAWTWTDISASVLTGPRVTIGKGRTDWLGQSPPTTISLTLRNTNGDFTPEHPTGAHYPNVVRNLPIQVCVPFGFDPPTERATAFVDRYQLGWDPSLNLATVTITASGRLRRMGLPSADPIRSALYRRIRRTGAGIAVREHWPMEDASSTTLVASATGGRPGGVGGSVSFGSDSDVAGSDPLPSLASDGKLFFRYEPYTGTGLMDVLFVAKVASEPGSTVTLATIATNGTARTFQVQIVPGSPSIVRFRVLDSAGTALVTEDVTLSFITEAEFYGQPVLFSVGAVQNGTAIDYEFDFYTADKGSGATNTLASRTVGAAVSTVFWAVSGLANLVVGHLGLYTDTAFDVVDDPVSIAFSGLEGNVGEKPWVRFARLCDEEGVAYDTEIASDETNIGMGVQSSGSLLAALRECEDTDAGVIHDGGRLGRLVFVSRSSKYNAAAALTLDMDSGQVAAFAPVHDDQLYRNEAKVTRSGGSSATVTGDTTVGTYRDDRTLSLESDYFLEQIAGWRAALGQAEGMRYPQIGLNLRRSPTLVQAWIESTRIGQRIAGTTLPSQLGPFDVDMFLEGYTETIAADEWQVVLNGSPAAPYDVPVIEGSGAAEFRLTTGGSDLTGDITNSATSIQVDVTGTALWSTTDEPWDIDIGGEQMTVTACTGASSPQTFTVTRSVNGVVKAHSAGAAVQLWKPRGLAL